MNEEEKKAIKEASEAVMREQSDVLSKLAAWQQPVRCAQCGDVIYSKRSGQYVSCECGAIAVDQTDVGLGDGYFGRHIGDPSNFLPVTKETYMNMKELDEKIDELLEAMPKGPYQSRVTGRDEIRVGGDEYFTREEAIKVRDWLTLVLGEER